MPRLTFIKPAAPILVRQPPTGPNWLHEIKWDGWRCQVIKDVTEIRIYTRSANDWTDHLPTLVDAVSTLNARRLIIDSEIIASTDGYDFYTLPAAIRRKQVSLVAFDLLHLNGEDLRRFPLEERKDALIKVVGASELIQVSETFNNPFDLLDAAEKYGLEGIVSKRKDLPYRSGRCVHWQKVKTATWSAANADRGEHFGRT